MATRLEMSAQPRTVTGKKTRFLRREGAIPAHIYGHGTASQSVQVNAGAVSRLLSLATPTTLVSLKLEGAAQPLTVLVREVQREPRTGAVLHVDFYEVRMTERIRAEVPVHLVGTSPAVSDGIGALTQNLHTIEVEALPGDLPPALEVDVSGLMAAHDSVYVRDLSVPRGVTIHAVADDAVVTVTAIRREELEEGETAAEPERVAREREEEEKE
jgi:large subunit ribosomal protein L25